MVKPVTRRTAMAGLGAASIASGVGGCDQLKGAIGPANSVFAHGVASGDPKTDSIVLWTRVETDALQEGVRWELAQDASFETLVAAGEATAHASNDHTVKVIPEGLEPGAVYYFRFQARDSVSMVGRTKTLPVDGLERLGVALASCSNFAFGFFNAYDAIAKDPAIDFVLHTGDYIYEYGVDGWGGDVAEKIGRAHEPAHETVTLSDYRLRHAQYKRDAGSLAMHAAHPLLVCWDDHESANNPWKGGAQNHQEDTEGVWITRRNASLKAYYEWMPIREPEEGRTRAELWRSYAFGDLATLVTLETRHTARGEQVDYARHHDQIETAEDAETFMREVIGDPHRKMISEGMEEELRESISRSVRDGQPWRLIGNASPIARMLAPDVGALGVDPSRQAGAGVPGVTADIFWKGKWNLPFYTDTWDGYPAAREAFYDLCAEAGANDLLVLTGDSHSFWANRLYNDNGEAMGLELGTAGISSPGDFVESGWDLETATQLDRIFEQELEEVMWTDNLHQGYVRVVLERERATADYIAVSTVLIDSYETSTVKSVEISKQSGVLDFA